MNNIIRNIFFLSIVSLMFFSCTKEPSAYVIAGGSFAGGNSSLSASSNSVLLTPAIDNNTAITFTWKAASFGQNPVVSYTIQIDSVGDTTAANGWSHAINTTVGSNTLDYSFKCKDFNALLNSLGIPAGDTSNVVIRVAANVPQNTGAATPVPTVYTNTVTLAVIPYPLSLYIPGSYQGWLPAVAPLLNPVNGRAGLYEGYQYLNDYTNGGTQYFKYTTAPDFNHTNYGDGGNNTFTTDPNAGAMSAPTPGYYELTGNFNTNTWTAVKTTWGIIGDATPGGWNTDTQMTYDSTSQVWTVTCNMIAAGSFKFRANGAWSIDFGIDGKGNLQYADNSFFGYNGSLNNLTVPSDGNYTITLDLHVSGVYNYSVKKN